MIRNVSFLITVILASSVCINSLCKHFCATDSNATAGSSKLVLLFKLSQILNKHIVASPGSISPLKYLMMNAYDASTFVMLHLIAGDGLTEVNVSNFGTAFNSGQFLSASPSSALASTSSNNFFSLR